MKVPRISRWKIFHCSQDKCWIVSKNKMTDLGLIILGVAECPDEATARAVVEAMELRDYYRSPLQASDVGWRIAQLRTAG